MHVDFLTCAFMRAMCPHALWNVMEWMEPDDDRVRPKHVLLRDNTRNNCCEKVTSENTQVLRY
jgi:hypothetical protein